MKLIYLSLCILLYTNAKAQNVGINSTGALPNSSSILDIDAIDKGLLIPRVSIDSAVDKSTIALPAASLLIFNTNTSTLNGLNGSGYYYNAGTSAAPNWLKLFTTNNAWSLTGNAGTNAGTNFIGTTDSINLIIKTNNKKHTTFFADGSWLVGDSMQGFGKKTFFDAGKGAFRTGGLRNFLIYSKNWDRDSLGFFSFACGLDTKATGDFSTAMGLDTKASGDYSTAIGSSTKASGYVSTAIGSGTIASGRYSTAMGDDTKASGDYSTAAGRNNTAPSYGEMAIGLGATTYTTTAGGDSLFRTANATDRLFVVGNAIDGNNNFAIDVFERSNALTILKNGNTAIGNITPTEKLEVAGKTKTTNFQMTNTAGLNRYLKSDALGNATWDSVTANEVNAWSLTGNAGTNAGTNFIGTTDSINLIVKTNNQKHTTFFADRSWLIGDSMQGFGTKTFFDAGKGAFRTGNILNIAPLNTYWNRDSLGLYSFASGNITKATGDYSTAMGYAAYATGDYSTAMGADTRASGSYSIAMGILTKASGSTSTAIGSSTTASGGTSTAMGYSTTASGFRSTAMGSSTTASGSTSTAMGNNTTASGDFSTVAGISNTAPSYGETVFGIGATTYTTTANGDSLFRTANATDRLFVVGNAIDANSNNVIDVSERSNALTILKNGNTGIGISTPLRKLHVSSGISGGIPNGNADVVLESNGAMYQHFLVPSGSETGLLFGSEQASIHGGVLFNNALKYLQFRTGGNNTRMTIDSLGNVGIGTTTPASKLEVNGALILDDVNNVLVTADNQAVTVGNSSYLRLTSDNTIATSRTIVLSNGLNIGQILFIECNEAGTDVFEIADGVASNTNLPATRTMTGGDIIHLIWNGANWLEISYSNN